MLKEQEPGCEIWGLDISEEMLRFVPAGIHTRAGSMTELPFEDGFFDAATPPSRWSTPWKSKRR